MINTARAYLKTEGKTTYRDCDISYYTYSMFDSPNSYRVNVNVSIQFAQNYATKSLALDDSFDKENEAINFGIEQGKKFIDRAYEQGKVSVVKPDMQDKSKNDRSKVLDKPKIEKK